MSNTNKAGTGKRVRRMKFAGNGARGRGHALKSRPGSKLGISMAEDAEAEEALPEKQRNDARAPAKGGGGTRRNKTSDGDRRHRTPSEPEKRAKAAAAKPSKRAPSRARQNTAESTGEAKRRKRTGGGFAGEKRAAPTPERDEE